MEPRRLLASITASLVFLLAAHAADAGTITADWLGAEVAIVHPDGVFLGQDFQITFSVDASTFTPGDALAFETYFHASDTIDITNATWQYVFVSDDPVWNRFFAGTLGDATTPTTHDASGYSSRFYDPVNGTRTWLWSDYNDKVVWTLQGLVLLDDTTITWTLDEFLNPPADFSFEIPVTDIPALPPAALVAAAAGLLGASARSGRLRRR